jgi:hypothetical protein
MLSPLPERPPGATAEASSTLRRLRRQLDEITCLDICELYGARRTDPVSALTMHHLARSGAEERGL